MGGLSRITADKPTKKQRFCQNIFLYFLIFSQNDARNFGGAAYLRVRLIHEFLPYYQNLLSYPVDKINFTLHWVSNTKTYWVIQWIGLFLMDSECNTIINLLNYWDLCLRATGIDKRWNVVISCMLINKNIMHLVFFLKLCMHSPG